MGRGLKRYVDNWANSAPPSCTQSYFERCRRRRSASSRGSPEASPVHSTGLLCRRTSSMRLPPFASARKHAHTLITHPSSPPDHPSSPPQTAPLLPSSHSLPPMLFQPFNAFTHSHLSSPFPFLIIFLHLSQTSYTFLIEPTAAAAWGRN